MLSREAAQVAQTAELATHNVQSKITSRISLHVAPLEALAARWGADADPWQLEWQSEAEQLHERYPALESIIWLDASHSVRWGIPSAQLRPESIAGEIKAAQKARKTTIVPVRTSDGDNSLFVFIPIFRHETFAGCVIATMRIGQWLHSIIDAEIPAGYAASISNRNEAIYLRDVSSRIEASTQLSQGSLNFYGMPWVVRVWPTADEWTSARKILYALSLIIGLLVYASGALAVAARRRARDVEWAKHQMAAQQEYLREANERLQAVIQATPLAVVALDLTGKVKSWNAAAERMFGWTTEEVIEQVPRFVPAEQMDEFQAKITRAAEGEMIAGVERRRVRKDGKTIEVAIWTAPLRDAAGSICGIIATIADISERKKLEEQLRHSHKMEAVGRLAGGVAHDFNNLLTVINGYGHMMLDSLSAGDRLRSHAEQIVKAGNQAAALTTQLLAFSRRQLIQPKSIDLNHVITNLEKMLRRVMGEDIILKTRLSPELHCVKADPNQMEQVLINLVANARDAMPRGGVLTITTRNVTLESALSCEGADIAAGGYIEMAVCDTGEGMDAETRSHLFEPFFTTKERGKGTGLGLSSVYGSVRQNAGGIFVQTEMGRGTSFYIYLPQLLEPLTAAHTEPVPIGIRRGSETVLVVEDEAPLRKMLCEALTHAGYHVLEASDGSDALRKWEHKASSIDILLTDVVMPLLNGRELAKRLCANAPHIAVIYMSGYADDVLAYHGTLNEGTILIQKPFRPAALFSKLREVLDGRKQRPPVPADPLYHRAVNS